MLCIYHLDIVRFIFYNICTVAVKNTRNIHAVLTNQIADVLMFWCLAVKREKKIGLGFK